MSEPQSPVLTPAQIAEAQRAAAGGIAATIPTDPHAQVDALNAAVAGAQEGREDEDPDFAAFTAAIETARAHGDPTPTELSADDQELADLLGKSRVQMSETGQHEANPLLHETPTEPAAPAAAPQEATALTVEEQETRARAFAALNRAGLELGDFKDEATALERGARLAKSQDDVDGQFTEWRQKLREVSEKPSNPGPNEAQAPGQAAGLTLEGLHEPLVASFTEQFGEDAGKAVGEVFPKLFSQISEVVTSRETALQGALSNVLGLMEERQRRDRRNTWQAAGATLSDEQWKTLQGHYEKLAAGGGYQGIDGVDTAMDHAYRITFGAAPPNGTASREAAVNQRKAEGVLTPPVNAGPPAPVSPQTEETREEFKGFIRALEMSERAQQAQGLQGYI